MPYKVLKQLIPAPSGSDPVGAGINCFNILKATFYFCYYK